LTALHGFLGLPSDWDEALPESIFGRVSKLAWAPRLHGLPVGDAKPALPLLADSLNDEADRSHSDVLLGYSMGGRIALHMLVQDRRPARWRKAIIVSASPGIAAPGERRRRWDQDKRWSERFNIESWPSLISAWDSQPIFSGETNRGREESDFDRGELASALARGSVGAQADLRPALSRLDVPVLWLAGERDAKYVSLAQECAALNPRFRAVTLSGAGHRLPWSGTAGFQDAVSEFLGK
jgi:2-succinyl-6-hydroxy-2,4-cyclohexadiene-1-carboxylate synthase